MAHWKTMMDHKWLHAGDLMGRDVTVTIERIEAGTLEGQKGKKEKKPVAKFRGKEKPLALNVTNCKTLTRLFGSSDVNDWIGKRVTLFPTTTNGPSGEEVECIRIRPRLPNGSAASEPEQPVEPPTEATSDAPPDAEVAS